MTGSGKSNAMLHQIVPECSMEQQALYKMQELLNQGNLDWKSREQKEAMIATLQGQTDVIAILPTGGGKSMLAIIPSLLEVNNTTILVLPLNSLIMDYERRLQAMHVPYQVYMPNMDINLRDNLVIVSADKSQTTQWRSALANHARRKTVARIVVDEAHIPLTSKGYRKSLQHFYDIRSEPVPIILLTATLPPSFLLTLKETYLLVAHPSVHRQGTNRPELEYVLEKMSSEEELAKRAVEIVQGQACSWQAHDRALVFVPSIGLCMDLVKKTGWHHYVGDKDTMNDMDRQSAYVSWMAGRDSNVMIATSAFSTGNDYPHVRLVLHIDKPFEMLEYVQGQGRAGRDGSQALCYTLVPTKQWKESKKQDVIEKDNEQAIIDHIHLYGKKRCLRYGITSYIDGVGVSCLEDSHNQRCSVCLRDPGHHPKDIQMATMPGKRVVRHDSTSIRSMPSTFIEAMMQAKELKSKRELSTLGEVEQLQRALRSVQHTCCICLIHKVDSAPDGHALNRCDTLEGALQVTWSKYKDWRKQLQYRKHHIKICYICHVPQVTDELHPTFTKSRKGGAVDCEYADIIAPTAFAVYHDARLKERAEARFNVRWGPNLTAFTAWLMGPPREKGYSNLVDLFLWYMETERM